MTDPTSPQEKLQAVINGARAILGHKTFKDSARAIFDYCCDLTGAEAGYVALLSEDGQENEVLVSRSGWDALLGGSRAADADPWSSGHGLRDPRPGIRQ